MDELEENYQKKEQRAESRASMVRGKYSMVPREEGADVAENNGSATEVASHSSKNSSSYCKVNEEQDVDKKKRRTIKSYFNAAEPVEESKTQSTQVSTQELLSNVPPRPTTKRAMTAR